MNGSAMRERGFVLAMVLWVVAILAIVAGFFAERVARQMELAREAQINADTLVEMATTRARILFRLGTVPMSVYGLGVTANDSIALDGRPYRGAGDTVVRLQDNRGLVNINFVSDERLHRFLAVLGVPAERRAPLVDTLRDYLDEDDLKRLNGGEAPEYAAAGLPAPRNEMLYTPFEARRILGWRDEKSLWENDRLPRLITAGVTVALNVNTAPREVLATLPGVTEEIASQIVATRQFQPYLWLDQIATLAGQPPAGFALGTMVFPGDSVRVTQSAPGLAWARVWSVTLTPNADTGPWRIDYYFRSGLWFQNENLKDIKSLPKAPDGPFATRPPLL
jgi:general secretion pathway protein K